MAGEDARALFQVFVGDCLAVIALVSTVSNLRGIWMMLISLIPVGKFIFFCLNPKIKYWLPLRACWYEFSILNLVLTIFVDLN